MIRSLKSFFERNGGDILYVIYGMLAGILIYAMLWVAS